MNKKQTSQLGSFAEIKHRLNVTHRIKKVE